MKCFLNFLLKEDNMKKVVLILCLFLPIFVFGVKKPLLKSGFLSNCDLKLLSNEKFIYPSSLKDAIFISFQEELSDYFSFYHKIEFEYKNSNKFTKDIDDLRNITLRNSIKFDFTINKSNKILFYTTPIFVSNSENIFKITNKIEYKLNLLYFNFNAYYSNSFTFKENELLNHKINIIFYFSIPKKTFIKYKTSLSVELQNYIYERKNISPLKDVNFSFEVAFDFNNKSFDEIFNNYKEEQDFNY